MQRNQLYRLLNRSLVLLAALGLAAMLLFSGSSPNLAAQTLPEQPLPMGGRALFTAAPDHAVRALTARPDQVGTQRTRHVTLNLDALSLANASRRLGRVPDDPGILLNLFDDTAYLAVNTRIEPRPLNRPGYIWYGHLPAVAYSSVVMLITDDGLADIRVLLPGINYYVDAAGGGVYRVSQLETYAQRGYQDAVEIQPAPDDAAIVQTNLASPRADDGSLIDVLVVYTPKTVQFLGSVAHVEIAIENTVALTNLTYLNSGLDFRLRLVHTEQVAYVEEPFVDLSVLTDPNDGVLDNVHTLRDTYQADLVVLIPGTSAADRGYCGIANLPTSLPAPSTGFSVTEVLCISDITFAHELGHNMGKAHDPFNAGGAVHPYAYGYQDVADPAEGDWGDFVTVMAYSTAGECPPVYQPGVCPAIAWWSNPDQTFNGKSLGTAGQNNALSLNQTALTIANYRVSADDGISTPTPTSTPPTPTLTPDPNITPTEAPVETELVLNGDFELDADGDNLPDGWTTGSQAVRKCGGGFSGACALLLKGSENGSSTAKAKQKLEGTETLIAGDSLTLTAQVTGKNAVEGGKLAVKVTYADASAGTDGKTSLVLALPAGTYAYTPVSATLVLEAGVTKAKLLVSYPGTAGKVTLDALSLVHTVATPAALPLP